MSVAVGTMQAAREFLADLRREVEHHAAVGHSVLARMRLDPRSPEDFRVLGGQHYPLVCCFTRYLECLLLTAPDATDKLWLARVLVDEYGEGSRGLDHAALYRRFLAAVGLEGGEERRVDLHPAVVEFIALHLATCAGEPFLVGLGAVGPGHEWAIPSMFPHLIAGLRRAGLGEDAIEYFTLHVEQDRDHGAWMEEALLRHAAEPAAQAAIRTGALRSLAARERFWWGVADKLLARPAREGGFPGSTAGSAREWTLEAVEARLAVRPVPSDPGLAGTPA
ncbi:MAG: iron-containing redox enzyme family protein [Planctomycetes bacterium]|nr:iron-containing redox enzyme family protein [Planctomycetota bacterium]